MGENIFWCVSCVPICCAVLPFTLFLDETYRIWNCQVLIAKAHLIFQTKYFFLNFIVIKTKMIKLLQYSSWNIQTFASSL